MGFLVRVKCGADVHPHLVGFCVEILWMFFFCRFSFQKRTRLFEVCDCQQCSCLFSGECEDLHKVQFQPNVHVCLRVRGILIWKFQ